jgi:hypothetical protein
MKNFCKEIGIDLLAGLTLSGLINQLMGEVVHSVFVVASGVAGAIAIYFTNRFLKSRFP